MTKEQKTKRNYKQWRIDEKDIGDEEILYRVNKRKWFYILAGDMLPGSLLLFISVATFMSVNVKIWQICVAVIFFIFGIRYFMSVISFDELIITKDRVIIRRFFVRDECIYIVNIKYIVTGTHAMMMTSLYFLYKNERFYQFYVRMVLNCSVSSLFDEDLYKIEELIKTLQQEQNDGKQ
jgi:hypothetical protein